MNTSNENQSLAPGDIVCSGGVFYRIRRFVLHLDLILVECELVEDTSVKRTLRPYGLSKMVIQ